MSDLNYNLFLALVDQARFADAISLSEPLLQTHQSNPIFLQYLAKAHLNCGDPEQAKRAALQAQALEDSFFTSQLLADIYFRTGEFASAVAVLERHKESLGSHLTLNLMGAACSKLGWVAKASDFFVAALALAPDFVEARNNLGTLYLEQGEVDKSIACYEKVIDSDPHHAQAYLNLGIAYQRRGDKTSSAKYYRRAFNEEPSLADALLYFSQVNDWDDDDDLVEEISAMLQTTDRTSAWRARVSLALANAYFAKNEKEKGFQLLSTGNTLRKLELPYEVESDQQTFATLVTRFKSLDLGKIRARSSTANRTPVFIVGMPRSGTSLLEQILDSHSQVHGCGELPFLKDAVMVAEGAGLGVSREAFQLVRSYYLEKVESLDFDENCFVDKMPLNFRWIGYIAGALPEAKIVHIRRQAPATCWSVYRTFFAGTGNRFANDLLDVAYFYDLYSQLMLFWNEKFPERMLEVDYDKLTENFEETVKRLLHGLGLEFEPRCLDYHNSGRAVATASALQVHQQVYQGSSDSWKAFTEQLQPMLTILEQNGHYHSSC